MKYIQLMILLCLFTTFENICANAYSERKDIDIQNLITAIKQGDANEVASLLRRRVDPNTLYKGKSALMAALRLPAEQAKPIVKALVQHNVDVNAIDDSGISPLEFAQSQGKFELSRLLLQYGATVTGYEKLQEKKSKKVSCPYKKAVEELEQEFYLVPTEEPVTEEEEEWTMIPRPEEEWEELKGYLG